jgi:N-acetylglucosamine kinase-like BadF-type ATPase
MSGKVEISKKGYLDLITRVFNNKLEERELALDRYRKADEQMESTEQFMMIGKQAVSYLNLASLASNDLANIAKEIKSIVYKNDEVGEDVDNKISSDWKNEISQQIEEMDREKGRKDEVK